jgi:hypothetical protein
MQYRFDLGEEFEDARHLRASESARRGIMSSNVVAEIEVEY